MYLPKIKGQMLWLLMSLFIFGSVTAQAQTQRVPHLKGKKVTVGLHLLALYDFDYSEKSFRANFFSWFVSDIPDYQATQLVEVTNSFSSKINTPVVESIGPNLFRRIATYQAEVFHDWDMRDFPFDVQTLKIHLEDTIHEFDELELIADVKNSTLSQDLILRGWQINDFRLESKPHEYSSNFGTPNTDDSTFSRLTLSIDIKREGVRLFFNYFMGFLVATLLTLIIFIIDVKNLSAKFSLAVAAIFALMTNKYIIDAMLPFVPGFSLYDAMQVSTFLFILTSIVSAVVESHLNIRNHIPLSIKIRRSILLVSLPTHIIFVGYFIMRAVAS